MRSDVRRPLCLCLLFAPFVTGIETVRGGDQSLQIASLISRLDDPSFHRRNLASKQLIDLAMNDSAQVSAGVVAALRQGSGHRSMELRMAARETLLQILLRRRDQQISQLLNPRYDAMAVKLDGWLSFCTLAGSDMPARTMFSSMSDRYATELHWMEFSQDRHRGFESLDPYLLDPDDAVGWAMLVFLDTHTGADTPSKLSARLQRVLGSSTTGPKIVSSRDALVFGRLVDRWIRLQRNRCSTRELLLIAMKYDCREAAGEMCDRVFNDPRSPAADRASALLCGLVLGRSDLEQRARESLKDNRVAHVWQLIAFRQKRIRTQVGDVALAVLLHHHGIDPRKAGFNDLQADRTSIFREHSLGFPDEQARQHAFDTANELLR